MARSPTVDAAAYEKNVVTTGAVSADDRGSLMFPNSISGSSAKHSLPVPTGQSEVAHDRRQAHPVEQIEEGHWVEFFDVRHRLDVPLAARNEQRCSNRRNTGGKGDCLRLDVCVRLDVIT